LWNGRYKTSLIDADAYFMLCSRYIESNPVRSGLVSRHEDYRWSSYCHHAGIRPDGLIIDHPKFWALGNTPFEREAAYVALFERVITSDEIASISKALLKGWPLGSEQFKAALQSKVKRRVLPAKRGRPFKIKQETA
jgi:putative transposase